MKSRFLGSFSWVAFAWLFALGAGAAPRPAGAPASARGGVDRALRDVADAPRLASRAVAATGGFRTSLQRPSSHVATPAVARTLAAGTCALRTALRRQAAAQRSVPRWRPYDAVAPPSGPRFASIAR